MTADISSQALACRDGAQPLAEMPTDARRALLDAMAARLDAHAEAILAANARDMEAAQARGTTGAMLDRLRLDAPRLAAIADAVRHVARLLDPVGQFTREEVRPNGIRVRRVRVPLGVVAMIYEARPNVTADAAALWDNRNIVGVQRF
ncbi:MAG TPA: gamma-glutamyl-phosphate reductase, partial [Chiayiivirga sp.]|nr:gamma-glutamyl-phosphate reductase [Chiayiivirga sp.]